MALFEELNMVNLIAPIREHLNRGVIWVNSEGKFTRKYVYETQPVWIHTKHAQDRDCGLWNKICFSLYRFVPSPCFDCWKIVIKPRNLKETMKVLDLQKRLDLPSKVGMEQREYTGGLGGWSGFWYAPLDGGLGGARKLCKRIRKAVDEQIDPDIRVYLKRACTEMEAGAGPTDQWKWNEKLNLLEDLITATFVSPPSPGSVPKFIEVDTMARWIYYAATHGDLSYLESVEKPFTSIVHSVEYQGSIHNEKDFPLIARKETIAASGFMKRKEEKEEKCLISKI